MLSIVRALRVLTRLRADEDAEPRLTPALPVVDPPCERAAPAGDPPFERLVEIPLYLEP